MADFNITLASPTECLAEVDDVIGALKDLKGEQVVPMIQGHLRLAAALSGNVALFEVVERADKQEMLESLKDILVQGIVKKAFEL